MSTNRVEGAMDKAAGATKEAVGKMTDNERGWGLIMVGSAFSGSRRSYPALPGGGRVGGPVLLSWTRKLQRGQRSMASETFTVRGAPA